jgi:hypothetical protein
MPTPTTTIPAFKSALVTALQASSALTGVQVSYGNPGDIQRSESIWVGDSRSQQQPSAMKSLPVRRDEVYTTDVMVEITQPRSTQEGVDLRATVLAAAVETVIAENPSLSVTGVLWSTVVSYDMAGGFDADGRVCIITIGVETHARL